MDIEHVLLVVLLVAIPGALVLLANQMLLKRFFEKEYGEKVRELKNLSSKKTLPLRLQAVERLVLYLERINPTNSVLATYKPGMSAKLMQNELVNQIRSEFEHNMAQQVYVGDDSWEALKSAKEETIKLINIASKEVGQDASALDMSNKLFELMGQLKEAPSDTASRILKREARRLF